MSSIFDTLNGTEGIKQGAISSSLDGGMVLAIDVVVVGLENGDWVRRLKTGAILDASQTKQTSPELSKHPSPTSPPTR